MSLSYEIFTIGLVLSADSFSAAVAMGLRPFTKKDAIKFALTSGGAEGLVALLGAMTGSFIISKFAAIDHWIAFFLLGAVAVHMAYEGISDLFDKNKSNQSVKKTDFHSFTKILIVSLATSLDAFGVGIGLGISHKPIVPFIISIGLWAFISTLTGLYLAKKLSQKFGPLINLFGAIILLIMAFQMLKI